MVLLWGGEREGGGLFTYQQGGDFGQDVDYFAGCLAL